MTPETDPTRIDWPSRQAAAAIPFEVIDGRPVNPVERTGRRGRGELWHWGEALAADALVTALDRTGRRWIVMVERRDGHGWAIPGGHVDPGETALAAAIRELAEETGLSLPDADWTVTEPRYVPDPRATDEAWMVTVLCTVDLGVLKGEEFPQVAGGDDAARAAWVHADTYEALADHLADAYGGRVFTAHVAMLQQHLADGDPGPQVWTADPAPGGWVCGVPAPGTELGVCGYPVESEPCPHHSAGEAS
ncbi:NUDIX domain-containing protein [Actinomadura keratinilytica]|uniref:Nudix hydrolase domain-containing protein n=1 Tax=Actinomadura keratinilytica TaxID=547461 RepID=A0ABP7ZF56_9ACTN